MSSKRFGVRANGFQGRSEGVSEGGSEGGTEGGKVGGSITSRCSRCNDLS